MISSQMFFCEECGAANPGDALYCFACNHPIDAASAHAVVQTSAAQTLSPVVPFSIAPRATTSTALLNNRYEIICEVGQGGFGIVYKARDTYSKSQLRLVAIKQINLSSLSPRQIIEATDSYNREVTLLSRLSHPNLPHIYDHFTDPEHWYLVMNFIQGETLEEHLKQVKHLSVKQTRNIGIQLANVLGYLHSQEPSIIFRDVKPGNIMLAPNDHLYLIDFGIARLFNPAKKRDTGALGSPGYAAPEQYGRTQSTDQTDIFGLGATLTTLLLGDEENNSPHTPSPRIPGKLRRLLNQMLEPDARKRPRNMRVVAQRLQNMLRDYKKMVVRYARSLLWGLLIGSFPYSLFIFQLLIAHIGFVNAIIGAPVFLIAQVFFALWPLVIFLQLISAIIFVFTPRRRLIGASIILTMCLIVFGLTSGWPLFGILY